MEIYLEKVKKEDKEILFRLLEYSLFEESLYDFNEMNNEGLFEYKNFDLYFNNSYFIKEKDSNKLLGFVILNINDNNSCIEEFMIIPKYRRQKIGYNAAFKCFNKYKTNWQVTPSFNSKIAFSFWKSVISLYTNNNYILKDNTFIFNNEFVTEE